MADEAQHRKGEARLRIAAALSLLVPAVAGCLGTQPHDDVVATFYPLQYLAQRIGGPDVSVGVVVRPGTEPHDYEPTVADLNAIQDAKLLVVQGAGFETWIGRARSQAPDTATVTATAGLDLRTNPDAAQAGSLAKDPHTWVDPPLYAAMARTVEAAMVAALPGHAAAMQSRADLLVAEIQGLDAEFRAGLAHCATPHVITGHAAFGYLAATYGFEQIPIQGLDPDAEPDTATINHVEDEARRYNITVIFFEDLLSPAVAQAVARDLQDLHAQTRVLSPIEAIAKDKAAAGASYFTVQRQNLANLEEAMRCAKG